MKRRTLLQVGLTVPLTLALGRASYGAQAPLPMTLWHQEARPTRVKAIAALCDAFNHSQNNVTVKPELQNLADVYMKISAAAMAGHPPDMMFTIPDLTMNVAESGVVQDVSAEVNKMKQMYKVDPLPLKSFFWDGKYWSVPLFSEDHVLWYRTDLFQKAGLDPKKPPKTWSELLATATTLVEKGAVKYGIGVAGSWTLAGTQQIYPLMVTAKAQDLFDAKGNVVFDNPNTVRAFEMYQKMFKMSPPGSETWVWDEAVSALFGGEIGMVIEKGQYVEQWDLRSKLPPELLAAAPVPIPDTDGQHATVVWYNGLLLLNRNERARAGFDAFVQYLYKPANMAKLLTVAPGFYLPVTEEAAQAKELRANATVSRHLAAYTVEIQESKYGYELGFTRQPYNHKVGRITGQNLISWTAQQMIHQGLSPEAAVKAGQQKMLEALH